MVGTCKEYFSLAQTLIGGILVFLGGLIGTYFQHRVQMAAQKKNLRSAFLGEISGLLTIVEKRHYLENLKETIEDIKEGGKENIFFSCFKKLFFRI